jgi:uncharacterized ion transporter superfamily protein YfcC
MAPMARSFRVPHTLVLLFGMVVVAQILTYVLPAGRFERVEHDGHEVVVPNSYTRVADAPRLNPITIFTAVPRGFAAAQGIIFFVFIIGGAFGVFRATGAADALIGFLLRRMGHMPALLVGGGVVLFAAGSSTIGMAEEYLPFVPVLLALSLGLGFDAVTAVGILCVGYAVGYGAAIINPFTVFIAQDIAGLPQGSGMGYRLILSVVFLAVGFDHVWRYARRVKADPSRSLVHDVASEASSGAGTMASATPDATLGATLSGGHVVSLAGILVALAVLIYGLKFWGWYLVEMGALFLGLSIVLGATGRLGIDRTAREFCVGAAELTTTALLIGFARSIQIVLDDGQVVDTIINGIAQPLQTWGSHAASVGMLCVQSLCNLFIPSGSGQAYVTMPIMAPLADLVGVTRQVAVLAYQFGDGFTNILVPTNAVLVGILAMARIPYERWLRFVLPFMVKVWVLGAIALVVAVLIDFA